MAKDLYSFALFIILVIFIARILIAFKQMRVALLFALAAHNVLAISFLMEDQDFLLNIGSNLFNRDLASLSTQEWSALATDLFWIIQVVTLDSLALLYWDKLVD
jgi:hypothetical protein